MKGGRDEALKIMNEHLINLSNYSDIRDYPQLIGTSKLSAHIKFGTISVRELYYFIKENLGEEHPLIRQLYWRDFFIQLRIFFQEFLERVLMRNMIKLIGIMMMKSL